MILKGVKENQKPVITIKTKIEKEYLVASTINVDVSIVDAENNDVTYSIYAYIDGRKYTLVNEKELSDSNVKFSYECFAIECENCYFVVEANDGYGLVSEQTSEFNVVKTYTPAPEPHVHEYVNGVCSCGEADQNDIAPKTKCGKKSLDLIVATLSIATLATLILRKKD